MIESSAIENRKVRQAKGQRQKDWKISKQPSEENTANVLFPYSIK